MGIIAAILSKAQQRAEEKGLSYAGTLLPEEAYTLLKEAPGAKLVDVRTRAELDWVGSVKGSIDIEWMHYPELEQNPHFANQLSAQVEKESLVMFLCRSGVRSHHAATLAAKLGYSACYNIIGGFEGDKDSRGYRTVNGWKHAGVPWIQP